MAAWLEYVTQQNSKALNCLLELPEKQSSPGNSSKMSNGVLSCLPFLKKKKKKKLYGRWEAVSGLFVEIFIPCIVICNLDSTQKKMFYVNMFETLLHGALIRWF